MRPVPVLLPVCCFGFLEPVAISYARVVILALGRTYPSGIEVIYRMYYRFIVIGGFHRQEHVGPKSPSGAPIVKERA